MNLNTNMASIDDVASVIAEFATDWPYYARAPFVDVAVHIHCGYEVVVRILPNELLVVPVYWCQLPNPQRETRKLKGKLRQLFDDAVGQPTVAGVLSQDVKQ